MISLVFLLVLKMTFEADTMAAVLSAPAIMDPASSVRNIVFLLLLNFDYLPFFLSLHAL